jgi:hypothetical protein
MWPSIRALAVADAVVCFIHHMSKKSNAQSIVDARRIARLEVELEATREHAAAARR